MQPKGIEVKGERALWYHYVCFDRHSLPCVPYLGPMLNELCILFEVSPTFLEPTEEGSNQKIVNFNKMRQVRM